MLAFTRTAAASYQSPNCDEVLGSSVESRLRSVQRPIPSPVRSTVPRKNMEVESIRVEFPVHQNQETSNIHTRVEKKHQLMMSNLKAFIFAKIKPDGKPILHQFKSHIEHRLHHLFPSSSTPSHPPYASMIQKAILELNDEKGSSKEAISAFLKEEYENLPWGHESFLAHHLKKLCGDRDIMCVNDERYMLVVKDCDFKGIAGSTKKSQSRRGKQPRDQGRDKIQKKYESERQLAVVTQDKRNSEMELAEIRTVESRKRKRPPTNCSSGDKRYNCIMSKLKDSVFEHLAAKDPTKSIEPEFKSHIEQRLQELFKDFDTPDHPPYVSMIQKAIPELNQKGWLTEEAISAFVKREFKDLPFGHDSFLHLRLMKLCKNRKLVLGSDKQYRLPDKSCDFKDTLGGGAEKLLHEEKSEEDGQTKEQKDEIVEIRDEVKEQTKEEHNEAAKQKIQKAEKRRLVSPCKEMLKQLDEQIILLKRGAQELAFNKQEEGPACFTATNSLDLCEESVMKTKEFGEKRLVLSLPWKGTKEAKYNDMKSKAKQKEGLLEEQQIVAIEGQTQLWKQEEVVLGLSRDVAGGMNLSDTCKKQPQIRSADVPRELVCAMFAQQKFQPKISRKQMAAKSPSLQVSVSPELRIDTRQQPPKSESQGRPAKRKRDKDMITENKLQSNDCGWKECTDEGLCNWVQGSSRHFGK